MFRTDEQKSAVCCVLLRAVRKPDLWHECGPTKEAMSLIATSDKVSGHLGYLSSGQSIILRVCFDLWNGEVKASFGDVVFGLDPRCKLLLGTLLSAMSEMQSSDDSAIDVWISDASADDSGVGYSTREAALAVSRKATATPRCYELANGTYAAGMDDTIDRTGRVTSWVELPSGRVQWSEVTPRP